MCMVCGVDIVMMFDVGRWWKAVSERKSVADTFVCKPRLISSYKQYSRNEATSNYGMYAKKTQ